jgi:putative membrane protein
MRRSLFVIPLLAALLLPAAAEAAQPTPMPVTDPQTFVNKAAPSNQFEIQSSALALKQTTTPTILMFARKMVSDHSAAGKAMAPAAKAEAVSVPATLDPQQMQEMAELQKLNGKPFDTAYVSMQLMAHDQAVMLFKGYAAAGKSGPLKSFAGKTLPTLEMHQQMIHSIAGR